MAASYISAHHGGGWRYGFHIPVELRPLWGNKRAFFRYIPRCPRREAEAKARVWAVDDAHRLEHSRKIQQGERTAITQAGGLPSLLNSDPPETDPKFWLRMRAEIIETKVAEEKHKVADQAALLAVSWDALFAEWVKVKDAKLTREHQRVIHRLKELFGERDCRTLTMQDIGRFRDDLITKTTPGMAATSLQKLNAMFVAAARNPSGPFAGRPNPAQGVKLLGQPVRYGRRDPFSPEQARHIIATAQATRLGDGLRKKRHVEALWGLRLLAFTGARPTEIFQLQGGDVRQEHGVRFIEICNTHAVTGKAHPKKSLKRGETSRKVPLHPEVMAFFDYAKGFEDGAFIFEAFRSKNGWASWLISAFPDFLRDDCQISEPKKKLVLYSFRHRFHVAMVEAEIPEVLQHRITGHRLTEHQKYGGDMLDVLAKNIPLVKPLG